MKNNVSLLSIGFLGQLLLNKLINYSINICYLLLCSFIDTKNNAGRRSFDADLPFSRRRSFRKRSLHTVGHNVHSRSDHSPRGPHASRLSVAKRIICTADRSAKKHSCQQFPQHAPILNAIRKKDCKCFAPTVKKNKQLAFIRKP